MKTSGWIASAVGAVVVVGGGIWGVNALTGEPETEAAPVVTETPEASTEPVETPTVEPTPEVEPTSAPVTVEPQPTAEPLTPEDEYLRASGEIVRGFGYEITDDELMAAGEYTCDVLEAGQSWDGLVVIEGITESMNNGVRAAAAKYLCPSALS